MSTPGELLDRLGVRWTQVTSETHGYDGTFTPRAALGHWTASAAGSNTAASVVSARSYHACAGRDAVVYLGGWRVRQGHAGEGRTAPCRLAVTGTMTLDALQDWQDSYQSDDTSSAGNQYTYGVCMDNNGVGEIPTPEQWHAWCGAMAVFTVLAGGTSAASVIDHSGYTNRKVDLSGSPAIDVGRWFTDVGVYIDLLLGEAPTVATRKAFRARSTPTGRGYYMMSTEGSMYTKGDAVYHGGLVRPDGTRYTDSPAIDFDLSYTEPGCWDGYWIFTEDGGVFSFPDGGRWYGSWADELN